MITINQMIRDMRELRDRGQLQHIVTLAYGVEGVSAGMYGRYDADVADQLWRMVRHLERAEGFVKKPGTPIIFNEVTPAEYRAIRARARRHLPHRDGVVSELSARGLQGRLMGVAGLARIRGRWGQFSVGDTTEVPQLLRGVADALGKIRGTLRGRRRALVWLRPRGPAAERFVPKVPTLEEFLAEEPPVAADDEASNIDEVGARDDTE